MILKNARQVITFGYIIISFVVLIICITGVITNYNAMMYISAGCFVWIACITLFERNFSLYQIFLATFFVFLFSRVALNCFNCFDMKTLGLMRHGIMSNNTALKTLNTLVVFLIGSSYAWIYSLKNNRAINYFRKAHPVPSLNNIVKYLYYVYIVLFVIKLGYFIKGVRTYGYLSIFKEGGLAANIHYPFFLIGVASIAEILFIILLYFNRDKKSFIKYGSLLLLAAGVKLLTGQRGYGFIIPIYLLYLWSTYYSEIKFTNIKLILFVALIPFLAIAIHEYRYSNDNKTSKQQIEKNIYVSFLSSQGCSLEVISGTIENNYKFQNRYPFLLGYFVDFVTGNTKKQDMNSIKNGNYLGHQLTYAINPNAYLAGRGTGTSIVAEVYSTAKGNSVLIFLLAFFLTLGVLYIVNNAYRNLYMFGISYYLIFDVIFSPRSSLFRHISEVVLCLFACLLFNTIQNLLKNKSQYAKC